MRRSPIPRAKQRDDPAYLATLTELSVEQARKLLKCRTERILKHLEDGDFISYQIGARTKIVTRSIFQWQERQGASRDKSKKEEPEDQ